jgi:hypothetical protein
MSMTHNRPPPPDFSYHKVVNTDVTHTLVIDKDVQAHAFVINNIGDAEADATASGRNSLAETHTFTDATEWSSLAHSESTSASDNWNYDVA